MQLKHVLQKLLPFLPPRQNFGVKSVFFMYLHFRALRDCGLLVGFLQCTVDVHPVQ